MSNLGELTEKEKQEQKVFAAFAKCSGLNISAASIRSCKPQKPDICCDLDGSDYFFELGEVVSEVQAETLSTKGMYSSGIPPASRPPSSPNWADVLPELEWARLKEGAAGQTGFLYIFSGACATPTSITKDPFGVAKLAIVTCRRRGFHVSVGVTFTLSIAAWYQRRASE